MKNMNRAILLCSSYVLLIFSSGIVYPQNFSRKNIKKLEKSDKYFIHNLLNFKPELFLNILDSNFKYKVQIIYTKIDRDKKNIPDFKHYTYFVNPREYFYPASLVKLPVAALSLEKIKKIRENNNDSLSKKSKLSKNTRMKIDSAFLCQKKVECDYSSENWFPSVAHYIKKMFLVSDNDAYSHLYEFLGQEYLNKQLWEMGYPHIRIAHRLNPACDTFTNRFTNPIVFLDENEDTIFYQSLQVNETLLKNPIENSKVGQGRIFNGELVEEPKDFSFSNYISLEDIHNIMLSLIFPQNVNSKHKFNLDTDDYLFLQKYLGLYPGESDFPSYKEDCDYYDTWKKYFLYGSDSMEKINSDIKIYNIVGQAYGFLSDCAYIVDYTKKIEFFLSATIYVNENGILGDGIYQYHSIGFPFFKNLGKLVYDYELKRKRKFVPKMEIRN